MMRLNGGSMKQWLVGAMLVVSGNSFADFTCQTLDGKFQIKTFDNKDESIVVAQNKVLKGHLVIEDEIFYTVYDYDLLDSQGNIATLKISKKSGVSRGGSCRARVCNDDLPVIVGYKAKFDYKDQHLELNCH